MRIPTLLILLLLTSQTFALSINYYRCEDASGEVVLSDRPCGENAQNLQIKIEEPPADAEETEQQQTAATPPPENEAPGEGSPDKGTPPKYSEIAIVKPVNGGVERSTDGTLPIGLSITPAIDENDLVQILLDGREIYRSPQIPASISDVSEGRHSLQANVIDTAGKVLIQSPVIHFIRF